ncbi:TetR/AcrR family transcriptional regulator [Actinophytocola oryzae]|uniref:TetR family transcriptional regulator n=1 Tax=Actinophytocola oryzae TaxID=502181 RepID=A0A4R7W3M5_9PSEU|nr:TetR family transcriptional regulator [Actinophytocola oryzae]TDV57246.1 TetR family transcriptional regulator [Actinophytocola oryzae]
MTATRGETRARLLDTALGLFTVHGVEGTSLQMIADALGVTKAAVYYHFRTKDEITEAVAEPAVRELVGMLDHAATMARPGARADYLIDGFVDLVVRNRVLVAVLCSDPGVIRTIDRIMHGDESVMLRLPAMLIGPDADESALVAAHVALAGVAMAGGSPALAVLDDEALRHHLAAAMRRLTGRPRRP